MAWGDWGRIVFCQKLEAVRRAAQGPAVGEARESCCSSLQGRGEDSILSRQLGFPPVQSPG